MKKLNLFSYVVHHDFGFAPNPYFNVCTRCFCKHREKKDGRANLVELAVHAKERGEVVWLVGTGGKDLKRSAGHGNLVYAMRVDEVLTRGEYYKDSRFRKKRPVPEGEYERRRGDNIKPKTRFNREDQFVLVSRRFYYFGRNPIRIPARFNNDRKLGNIEKAGPGFRKRFDPSFISAFVRWIENREPGMLSDPWGKQWLAQKEGKACKSSCSG